MTPKKDKDEFEKAIEAPRDVADEQTILEPQPEDQKTLEDAFEEAVKEQATATSETVKTGIFNKLTGIASGATAAIMQFMQSRTVSNLRQVGLDVSKQVAEDKVADILHKFLWELLLKYIPHNEGSLLLRVYKAETIQMKAAKTALTAMVFAPVAAVLINHSQKCMEHYYVSENEGDLRKAKLCLFFGRACFRTTYKTMMFDLDAAIDKGIQFVMAKLPEVASTAAKAAEDIDTKELEQAVYGQQPTMKRVENTQKMSRKDKRR